MCISPIKIKNRSLHFTKENNPYNLFVPCGRCYECRQQKQDEWFVRSFLQWQYNIENSTFFYTLTYNNASLPYSMGVPSFSKRHVQLFLKRLRKELSKECVVLKYLISSENGERYGRPHYHGIFYLSVRYNPYRFYKLVEKCWTYGFVKYGDNVGVVTDMRGIKYVTKYVTKDITFMRDNGKHILLSVYNRYNTLFNYIRRRYNLKLDFSLFYDVNEYKYSMRDFYGKSVKDTHPYYELSQAILRKARFVSRQILPFHLQSTNLGSDMLGSVYVDAANEQIYIPCNDSVRNYPLPRYFKRKLWYDMVENEIDGKRNKFVLNEAGKSHLLDTLDKRISQRRDLYTKAINYASKLNNDNFFDVVVKSKSNFVSLHDLVYFCKNIDLDFHALAIYDVCLRGRVNYMDNCPFTPQLLKDNYYDIVSYHLNAVMDYDMGKIYETNYFEDTRKLEYLTFNYHPFFQAYEKVLTILEAVYLSARYAEIQAKEEAEALQRETREILLQKVIPF